MSYSTPIPTEVRFGTLLPDIMGFQGYQTPNGSDDFVKDGIQLEFLSRSSRGTMSNNSRRRSSFLPPELSLFPKETRRRSTNIYRSVDNSVKSESKIKNFCTGSKYVGDYNQLGMSGRGIYKYPHGVIYDGYFNRNGEFHGSGTLIYPGGQKIEGYWKNGRLTKGATLLCCEQSAMSSDYCKTPDRRFQIEINTQELKPAGQEYLTNAPVARPISPGMYDTGSGFYDPVFKLIYDYDDPCKSTPIEQAYDNDKQVIYQMMMEKTLSNEMVLSALRRRVSPKIAIIESVPTAEYIKWIFTNCRKGSDEPIGYRPELYEIWTPGYRRDDYDLSFDTYYSTGIDLEDSVSRFSQLTHSFLQPSFQSGVSQNRYSKMYSFIRRYPVCLSTRRDERRRSTLETLKNSSVSQTKRMTFHLQKKSKKTGNKVSPIIQSIKSTYGLKYLKLQQNAWKKKQMNDDLMNN